MTTRPRKSRRRHPEQQDTPRITDLFLRGVRSPFGPPVFFGLLAVIYFWSFVFSGNVIVGIDTGTDFQSGSEPFLQKLAELAPANWSRYLGGTPMSGSRQPSYFPLYLIHLFTDMHHYLGWRYFFAMFFAGYFMFLCARGFKLSPLVATFAGIVYASSPALLTFTYAGHEAKMLVIGLFPLMVWGLYRGMATCRPAYFLTMSVGVGVAVYTPHLQMVYYALWGLGLVFVWEWISLHRAERDIRKSLRRGFWAAGAVCIGLSIGAMGTFPAFLYTKSESRRAGDTGEGLGVAFAQSWSLHPEEMASLVVPEFVHFDNHQQRSYWGRNAFKLNSEYIGIIVLFLALLSLPGVRRDRRAPPLLILFAFAAAFSMGPHTHLHTLLYHLVPGMRVLRAPGMIAFLFVFPVCLLAAIGLNEQLLESRGPENRVRRLAWISAAAVCLLVLLAALPETALGLWIRAFWPDIPQDRLQMARANLPSLVRGATLAAFFVSAVSVLGWRLLLGKLSPTAFVILISGMSLVDTWRIDKQFLRYEDPRPYQSHEESFPATQELLTSGDDLYRALVLPPLKFPEVDNVLVHYPEPFTVRRYDKITRPENRNNLPVLNLLNTRYIVSKGPLSVPSMHEVLVEKGLHTIENSGAYPWFYLAPSCVVERDEERILHMLKSPAFDAYRTVIVEQEVSGLTTDGRWADNRSGQVERLAYDSRKGFIRLQVSAPGAALLVVSENSHPNWRAFVDGDEQPVLRANFVWQAVRIPPGNHIVEFRYTDTLAIVCRWITFVTSACLVVWFGFCLKSGRLPYTPERGPAG